MSRLRVLVAAAMAAFGVGRVAPVLADDRPASVEVARNGDVRQALERFIAQPKFQPHDIYRAPSEAKRRLFEARVNALGRRLLNRLDSAPSKGDVLEEFKPTLKEFDLEDSDDQDEMLHHVEQIMAIFGIESSDGLLNQWRYGFDPSQPAQMRNADAKAQMTAQELALLEKLESVRPESAVADMVQLLGQPTFGNANMQTWVRSVDGGDNISLGLNTQLGAWVIAWSRAGRPLYLHKL